MHDPESFFQATAQVMPLLLLIGIVDFPGVPQPDDGPRHRLGAPERRLAFARLISVIFLTWGEIAALTALAGRPTELERQMVLDALVLGGLAVVDRVIELEFDRLTRTMRRRGQIVVMVVVLVALFGPFLVAMLTLR